jgi:hypothetical protein
MRFMMIVALCAAAMTVTLLLFVNIKRAEARSSIAPHLLSPPTAGEVAVALHRLSLDAPALAASGLTAQDASTLIQNTWNEMAATPETLRLAHEMYAAARAEVEQLEEIVRAGVATSEQVNQLPVAQASLVEAQEGLQSVLDGLFATATSNLTAQQVSVLSTIRSNRLWDQPIEYLTVNGVEPERVDLREALANERISIEQGVEPDPANQLLLAQWRSLPAVASAQANLQTNLDLIEGVWDQAVIAE